MRRKQPNKLLKNLRVISYRNWPLQSKILLNHLLLIIVPVTIIFYAVFDFYMTDKINETKKLISQVDSQAIESIDSFISDIEQLTTQPLYNDDLMYTLNKSNDEDETNGKFTFEEMSSIRRFLNYIMASKKYIYSSFIFNLKGSNAYQMVDSTIASNYDPSKESWFINTVELQGSPFVRGSFKYDRWKWQGDNDFYLFSVSRVINNVYDGKKIGLISIDINSQFLRDICNKIKTFKGEYIFILDENNTIIYDSNENNITKKIKDSTYKDISYSDLQKKNSEITMGHQKYIVNTEESLETSWKLVRLLPENILYSDIRNVERNVIILVSVFVFVSLLISIFTASAMTMPLKKLTRMMKIVEQGDFKISFSTKYDDEIGQLGKSFNHMLMMIDQLLDTIYLTQERKKEAELYMLQSQINPHFIYNTLESIRMLAESNDDIYVSKSLFTLGKLLRYSVDINNKIVSVKDEVDYLNNYLYLQNFRFSNRLQFNINLDNELYEYKILKLLFQPIVENAIQHGLEPQFNTGVITITGYKTSEGICFDISDNGVGISEYQLIEINEIINDFSNTIDGSKMKSIGLRNINERIKLHYGESYGIQIISAEGKGTLVRLNLPNVI